MENPIQMNGFQIDLDHRESIKRKSKSSKVFSKLPFALHPSAMKQSNEGQILIKDKQGATPLSRNITGKSKMNELTVKAHSALRDIDDILNRKLSGHTDILEMAWTKEERVKAAKIVEESEEEKLRNKVKVMEEQLTKKDVAGVVRAPNEFEETSKFIALKVYMSWIFLLIHAHFREFLRSYGFEKNKSAVELPSQRHFQPLYNGFDSLFMRNCYMRVRDVFERPIGSCPGATVNLVDRTTDDYCWTFKFTGTQTKVINVGSYNYLGFAQNSGPCADASAAAIDQYGITTCTNVQNRGLSKIQCDLEKQVAEYLGTEDSLCFSMGFATNSMNTPCLVDKNSLIISDQLNHASLALGCRLSRANINIFKHNNMRSLEQTIRNAIAYGNPKTHRPYKKILIIVEGIYSMEGSICNLPAIIALKKKYNCYLYLDEAHSIGAMGPSGKGIVEYWGCDVNDVDIMMGTFTKSFGAAGGYIAGKKKVIDHIRTTSPTSYYSSPMSPPVAQQVFTSMSIIMGKDGTDEGKNRIEQLARNAKYFRKNLKQKGFIVYGSDDSPVVPVLFYYPADCGVFGREMLERKIGVVVVSYPATPMTESRARICLSAAHTKEQLDIVLEAIDEVGEICGMKYSKKRDLYKNLKIEW
uniref:Aminotran_1_2 domain-containing protein n=1 Tax=Rhabditophanes sp. KR3021 TaxID=114890 RepID=A0AC35U991_9BILA